MNPSFTAMLLAGEQPPFLGADMSPAPPPGAAAGGSFDLDDLDWFLGGEFLTPALSLQATASAEARAEARAEAAATAAWENMSLAQLFLDAPPAPQQAADPLLAPNTQLRRWKKARAPLRSAREARQRATAKGLCVELARRSCRARRFGSRCAARCAA